MCISGTESLIVFVYSMWSLSIFVSIRLRYMFDCYFTRYTCDIISSSAELSLSQSGREPSRWNLSRAAKSPVLRSCRWDVERECSSFVWIVS